MKEYFHGKRKDAYDESLIEEREIERERGRERGNSVHARRNGNQG